MSILINVYKVENGGGVGGQKSPKLVNIVYERLLRDYELVLIHKAKVCFS